MRTCAGSRPTEASIERLTGNIAWAPSVFFHRGGQSARWHRRCTASGGLVFLALLDGTIAAFDDTTLDRRLKARLGNPRFQIVREDLQLTPPKNPKARRRWGWPDRPRHPESG
jgi:hypothetical protein